ncbi:hypothetical protein TNCV_3399831 [Trichonephila clavipes]|nr:hypothetical protein TNCV_3399831 [Trichonephila clavipes]
MSEFERGCIIGLKEASLANQRITRHMGQSDAAIRCAGKNGWTITDFGVMMVVKVSNHGWHVSSSSPVPQKTRRVRQRCTLNLSRAEMSSRWCGVVVRRGGASSGVALVI